jgi:hypothetical protein
MQLHLHSSAQPSNHARFFVQLVASMNRTSHPSGSSATAGVALFALAALPPPQKNVGTVPRPNNTTDRSVVIDHSMPTPNWLTVRAIPCCLGGGALASIQVWWLIANPYVWLAGTA